MLQAGQPSQAGVVARPCCWACCATFLTDQLSTAWHIALASLLISFLAHSSTFFQARGCDMSCSRALARTAPLLLSRTTTRIARSQALLRPQAIQRALFSAPRLVDSPRRALSSRLVCSVATMEKEAVSKELSSNPLLTVRERDQH